MIDGNIRTNSENEFAETAEGFDNNTVLKAKLYLCATPIGNMGDITKRVESTLANCDAIFCEDTRNTRSLLEKLGIKGKRLSAAHTHNEQAAKGAPLPTYRTQACREYPIPASG